MISTKFPKYLILISRFDKRVRFIYRISRSNYIEINIRSNAFPITINSISFHEKKWKENVSLILFCILHLKKKKSSINSVEFQFNLQNLSAPIPIRNELRNYRQDFGTVKLQPLQLPQPIIHQNPYNSTTCNRRVADIVQSHNKVLPLSQPY